MSSPFNPRLLAAFALLLPALSHASTRLEVQAGRSYMDSHGANTAFVEVVFAPHAMGNTPFTLSPDVSAGWIASRDLAKFRDNHYDSNRSVALLAAGARLNSTNANAWYRPLYFSFQVADINHTTQALSTHYQFVSTLGWQWRRLSVAIRHVSNGSTHSPNRGETMALVGVGFDI